MNLSNKIIFDLKAKEQLTDKSNTFNEKTVPPGMKLWLRRDGELPTPGWVGDEKGRLIDLEKESGLGIVT